MSLSWDILALKGLNDLVTEVDNNHNQSNKFSYLSKSKKEKVQLRETNVEGLTEEQHNRLEERLNTVRKTFIGSLICVIIGPLCIGVFLVQTAGSFEASLIYGGIGIVFTYLGLKGFSFSLSYGKNLDKVKKGLIRMESADALAYGSSIGRQINHYEEVIDTADELVAEGQDLSRRGFYSDSIKLYNEALKIDADNYKTWYLKGLSFSKLTHINGSNSPVIECYDKALELNPEFGLAWQNKGVYLSNLGKHEEAVDCYNEALKVNPQLDVAWQNKGLSLQKIGNLKEAIICYDKALEINPNNSRALDLKIALQPDYMAKKQKKEELNSSLDKKGLVLAQKGYSLILDNKNEKGIEYLTRSLALNPDDWRVWFAKGTSLYRLEKYNEAVQCLNKALDINSELYESLSIKVLSLYQLGRYKEALECCTNLENNFDKISKLGYELSDIQSFKNDIIQKV